MAKLETKILDRFCVGQLNAPNVVLQVGSSLFYIWFLSFTFYVYAMFKSYMRCNYG